MLIRLDYILSVQLKLNIPENENVNWWMEDISSFYCLKSLSWLVENCYIWFDQFLRCFCPSPMILIYLQWVYFIPCYNSMRLLSKNVLKNYLKSPRFNPAESLPKSDLPALKGTSSHLSVLLSNLLSFILFSLSLWWCTFLSEVPPYSIKVTEFFCTSVWDNHVTRVM